MKICLCFVLAGISTFAANVSCAPTTPTNVTVTGTLLTSVPLTSVVCGPITFSGFQSQDASGGTTTGNPLSYIPVASNYNTTSGLVTLALNPNYGLFGINQDTWVSFGGVSTSAVSSVGLLVGSSGSPGGISENICNGSLTLAEVTTNMCTGSTQLGFLSAPLGGSANVTLSAPTNNFVVLKDVNSLNLLTSFVQTFQTTPSNTGGNNGGVPEPATMGMLGAGLVGLYLKKRKVL